MNAIPPLNPLRAFEAAARHASIRHAADELLVTPGAVSRQVRVLEDYLGVLLFRRLPAEIVLTADGERYFKAISPHFEAIAEATNALVGRRGQDIVRICAYTTFSSKWLIPRLASFSDGNPETELRLTTSLSAVEFDRENVDAAVRLGDGNWPGLEVERLFNNTLVPLCTSAYAAAHRLREPKDLARARLLHCMARPDDWRNWAVAAGVEASLNTQQGIKLASSILSYKAALEGQGIMMGQRELFQDDLDQGLLIAPCGPEVSQGDFTYYLVFPRNRLRNPAMRHFRRWLMEEISRPQPLSSNEPHRPLLRAV